MQREHRQCNEGSEGLSLIFVPSFGKVGSDTKREYTTAVVHLSLHIVLVFNSL